MHVELKNLPRLTIPQANAIEAYFSAATLPEAAAIANTSLAEFLDTLADEAVQAHLKHAQQISAKRTTHRLTDAAHTATQVLETLAADANADPIERRRAASIILRAHRAPEIRPRRRHSPERDLASLLRAVERLAHPPNQQPAPHSTPPPARSDAQSSDVQPPNASHSAHGRTQSEAHASPARTTATTINRTPATAPRSTRARTSNTPPDPRPPPI